MIPTINIVAVVHLAFVSVFIGLYAAEAVLELYANFHPGDEPTHRATITMHYWIDVLIEIPVVLGIIVSGLLMATLVVELTALHWIKIAAVVLFLAIAVICPIEVVKRYALMRRGGSEEGLRAKSKRVIYSAAFSATFFFSTAFALGFWLAYHRVIESIYTSAL